MTTPKPFTAGPWRVQADPVFTGEHPLHDNRFVTTDHEFDVHPDYAGEFEMLNGGEIICSLRDNECQAANARLIAAAPELLAALKVMVANQANLTHAGYTGDWEQSDEVISSRAAIRKAIQ